MRMRRLLSLDKSTEVVENEMTFLRNKDRNGNGNVNDNDTITQTQPDQADWAGMEWIIR